MSMGTVIVSVLVVMAAITALKSLLKKGSSCAGCSQGCSSAGCASCAAAGKMVDDMRRNAAGQARSCR